MHFPKERTADMMLKTVLFAGLALAANGVFADTWYVDDATGSDSNDGSEGAPFKTIQKALDLGIDTLKDGEIVVRKGIYKLGGNPIHGNLYCKLRGETDDPADVVVDAENLSECARFAGIDKKPPFIVSGITFVNGNKPTDSTATYCALSVVKNVVVSNCVVASCGSADVSKAPVSLSDAKMAQCVISNCVSLGRGSALRLGSDGVFEKGLITGCRAPSGVYGAIFSQAGGVLRDSVISNNTARLCPGVTGVPQEISGCLFIDNYAAYDNTKNPKDGGALVIAEDSNSATIPELCIISNCVVTGTVNEHPECVYGAGINIKNVSVQVVGCTVSNNISKCYTGLYARKDDLSKTIEIVDCVFSDNEAKSGDGGGAYLGNGVKVRGCTFSGNTASVAGGGVYGLGFEMDGCVISNNTAKCGGGICVVTNGVAAAAISNSVFRLNSSTHEGGALSVGYLYKTECAYTNGYASVYSSMFEENSTEGLSADYPGGGAVSIPQKGSSSALIEGCVFKYNKAENKDGGKYGGAISYRGTANSKTGKPAIDIRSSLFLGNTAGTGGGVYLVSGDDVKIDNCTFVTNNATVENGGDDTYVRWSGVRVRNCIYEQNKNGFEYNSVHETAIVNCCIKAKSLPSTVSESNGNVAVVDMGFADAENGDYSLKRDSVCVGRGVMLKWMERRSKDAAGSRRVCGSLPDLGAFEYYFPVGLKMSVR